MPHHESLAFADGDTAAEEAAQMRVLAACRTYGEARRLPVRHIDKPGIDEDETPDDGLINTLDGSGIIEAA